MHIFLLETFYFIRKLFYLDQIVLFSLLFLKFMASHILDSNRAKLPLWNCKSQDSRTGYMSFWLCISWQFSYGILGLKRSDRSCRFFKTYALVKDNYLFIQSYRLNQLLVCSWKFRFSSTRSLLVEVECTVLSDRLWSF